MLTKNSERYVGDAVRSVSSQSNQNFELIIQDGMSDDRTLEIIKNEYPDAKVVSEPDQNTTEAATKALARCSGSIIGFVDSDNMLPDDALFFVENYFNTHPETDIVYGGVQMIGDQEENNFLWPAPDFDPLQVITHAIVLPWGASFFNVKKGNLTFKLDQRLTICADFALWLSFLDKNIQKVEETLSITRISETSISCQSAFYKRILKDKTYAFNKFVEKAGFPYSSPLIRDLFLMNINAWAAYFASSDVELKELFKTQAQKYHSRVISNDALANLDTNSQPVQSFSNLHDINLSWSASILGTGDNKSEFPVQKFLSGETYRDFPVNGPLWTEIAIGMLPTIAKSPTHTHFVMTFEVKCDEIYLAIYGSDKQTLALEQKKFERGKNVFILDLSLIDDENFIAFRAAEMSKEGGSISVYQTQLASVTD